MKVGLWELEPGQSMSANRGEAVVCIPVRGAEELFARCLESVLTHTPAAVSVLIADDATPGGSIRRLLADHQANGGLQRDVVYVGQAHNVGLVRNLNDAFGSVDPADVVVLNSDCVVAEGWFEGLREAAYSGSTVATATALTNHGSILSVPYEKPRPALPDGRPLDDLAAAVRVASLRTRPVIPTAIGHCFYVRRDALDLVGPLDTSFSPGYGEEVDFSQRCRLRGLSHVAADDVLVFHRQGGTFGTGSSLKKRHERLLERRYPYYHREVNGHALKAAGPLGASRSAARRAMLGLSIAVDARCLGTIATGTQVQTLELIQGLSDLAAARLSVIVPEQTGSHARRALAEMRGVEVLREAEAREAGERADVALRPYQVTSADDVGLLRTVGERIVIQQLDLIAFHNPGYFDDFDAWQRYRDATRAALANADRVTFPSRSVMRDALAEELVEPSRAHVVRLGIDHRLHAPPVTAWPPAAVERRGEPFLFCLGADFRHKNRLFALQLFEALRTRHAWPGCLVLAGPQAQYGSSATDEAAFLATRPALAAAVTRIGAVSEEEKAWLLSHARAVVYPTVSEGFGFLPFEAAAAGTPCVFAAGTSLAELLPAEAATIVPWSPAATSDRVFPLLSSGRDRDALVGAVRSAGERLTWSASAANLLEEFHAVLEAPHPPARMLPYRNTDFPQLRVHLRVAARHFAGSPRRLAADWLGGNRRQAKEPIPEPEEG